MLDQIRGRSYEEAIMILEYMPYKVRAGMDLQMVGGLLQFVCSFGLSCHVLGQPWLRP